MPSYKTHSIHGEIVLQSIDKKIDIDKEDVKIFCIGPDIMIGTDYKLFDHQHSNKVKEYFKTLLKLIKQNKLQDDSKIMSLLYGQLDHYTLDTVMHPLIYYMTEDISQTTLLSAHSIIEMWLDDYTLEKYGKGKNFSYSEANISDRELNKIIDKLYMEIYNSKFAYLKYKYGLKLINIFDLLVRKNYIRISPKLLKLLNMGDIQYQKNNKKILEYLNLNHDIWYNPETGDKANDSFDDLWKKSLEISLQNIEDVNNYLYLDKELKNPYIENDISYNTGFPCNQGQSFRYVKKYKKKK